MGSQNKSQFIPKKYPGHAGCIFQNPTAKISKTLKLTKNSSAKFTLSKFSYGHFDCCFDKPAENIPSKVQNHSNRSPEKLHPFQKSSVFLKTFLRTRRCSSVKAGKKTLTKSANFLIRVQKKRWKTFFEKFLYSMCSFGRVECIFDSSAVKTFSNNRSFLLKVREC